MPSQLLIKKNIFNGSKEYDINTHKKMQGPLLGKNRYFDQLAECH